MKNAIPYYRVSTVRQGHSGLGLEAQQKSVNDFSQFNNLKILKEFIEIESGRKSQRPVLQEAIQECKKNNAVLLIAKLDRLSRNLAFITSLLEAKVEFMAVDNPQADRFTIHILAAVAEKEAKDISKRTKDALRVAKSRGVELGKHGTHVLSKLNKQAADDFAKSMVPMITLLMSEGFTTRRAIRDALNERNILPSSGEHAKWHLNSVHSLLRRIENFENVPILNAQPYATGGGLTKSTAQVMLNKIIELSAPTL